MNDLISRQAAIDALDGNVIVTSRESAQAVMDYIRGCADRIRSLPSAQPSLDEWCYSCKEYDSERHCCPRWNRVIRQTLKEAQPDITRCKDCKNWDTTWQNDWAKNYHYCPLIDGTRNGDWYCADAERRKE